MGFEVKSREKERAIRYLTSRSGARTLRKVWDKMQSEGPFWYLSIRESLLLWLADALAAGGFSWHYVRIHEIGIDLLEEAARRSCDPAAHPAVEAVPWKEVELVEPAATPL